MADPRQMLEAKKAKILADAKKAVAEIQQDIDKIDQFKALASKYGLEIVEQNRSAASGNTMAEKMRP